MKRSPVKAKNLPPKKPSQSSHAGLAIVNRYGQFWTRQIFETEDKARKFFDDFWKSPGFDKAPPWADYKLVRARQTISFVGDITPAPRSALSGGSR